MFFRHCQSASRKPSSGYSAVTPANGPTPNCCRPSNFSGNSNFKLYYYYASQTDLTQIRLETSPRGIFSFLSRWRKLFTYCVSPKAHTHFDICSDPAVHALQFLDVINMKDPGQKSQFYRTTLKDILPSIPKVKKKVTRVFTTETWFL